MEPQDVERVKKIVRDELGPALEIKAKEIEGRMTAHITAFQQQIEVRVEHQHSENRARSQMNFEESAKAAARAAEAVAGNEFILRRMDDQDKTNNDTQSLVRDLLVKVSGLVGHHDGEVAAEERQEKKDARRRGIAKVIGGAIFSGGVGKWLSDHFHWFGGSK